MSTLYLLAGPTASGKTELAIRFALNNNCEILSCDASSFYRGMDIGTAKPTFYEQSKVKHWGIDIVNPSDYFSIKNYIDYAKTCINSIVQKHKNILVVGGSGFYLKSFLQPMLDNLRPNAEVTKHINEIEHQGGIVALQQALTKINPDLPQNFDLKNLRKVKKALERCLITGRSIQQLQTQFNQQTEPFPYLNKQTYLLQCPLEILKLRIRLRTYAMIKQGLIDEVKSLLDKKQLLPNSPASLAIGYRETIAFIQQPTSIDQLAAHIIQNTYELVKKQTTWFRHQIKFDRYIYANCF